MGAQTLAPLPVQPRHEAPAGGAEGREGALGGLHPGEALGARRGCWVRTEPAGETEQNLQGRRNGVTRKRRGGVTLSEGDLHKVISAVARLNGVDMKPLICETAYYNITWYALRTVFLH